MSEKHEYKILFVGAMGAGKTTAIQNLSDETGISTDVQSYDQSESGKSHTTVGFDYGRIHLNESTTVRLVGTPGQERFSFLWASLAVGALGLIILVDVTRPDPLADIDLYTSKFPSLISNGQAIICLSKFDPENDNHWMEKIATHVEKLPVRIPVIDADVRDADQTRIVLELLISQIEHHLEMATEA
jgi:uncharacterized protein